MSSTPVVGQEDFRDLAADVVRQHQEEMARLLAEGNEPELEESVEEIEHPQLALFKKIEFSWRAEDKNAITQLRAAAERVFDDLFSESVAALDTFYQSVWVPDPKRPGRYVMTESGKYKEDWDQLTGQDAVSAIFTLQRERVVVSQKIANLFLEAVFAKYISTDTFNEGYRALMEGTVGDRTAYANQQSKVDRYAAFFRYWIWHTANSFQKEIDNTIRLLEKLVDWRTRRSGWQSMS